MKFCPIACRNIPLDWAGLHVAVLGHKDNHAVIWCLNSWVQPQRWVEKQKSKQKAWNQSVNVCYQWSLQKKYSCFEPTSHRGFTIPQLCSTNNRNYQYLRLHALLSALLCIGPQVWQIRLLSQEGADTIAKCKWLASFQCRDSVGTYISFRVQYNYGATDATHMPSVLILQLWSVLKE